MQDQKFEPDRLLIMSDHHSIRAPSNRKRREYDGMTFLKQGFRPFFLGAGIWSALSMSVWIGYLLYGQTLPLFDYLSPVDWHMHEMLFGFFSAAMAGFLLTAVPNWTGRLPVRGMPLALLALVWLAGRVVILLSGAIHANHHMLIAAIDGLFLISFTLLLAREILAGSNWKNIPVIIIVTGLAISNILFHMVALDLISFLTTSQIALAAILLVVVLVNLIGGRVVPSFTRNWLARHKLQPLPASRDFIDQIGFVAIILSSLLLLINFGPALTGIVCILTAMLHLFRLYRWRGWAAKKEALVLILHIGYGWIAVGFFLAGLSILMDGVPFVAAIHAFSAGMLGSMILAIMTRATRGHSGAPLEADGGTIAIFILVNLSAIVRVASAILGNPELGILVSGLAWIASFTLFSLLYLPFFIKR